MSSIFVKKKMQIAKCENNTSFWWLVMTKNVNKDHDDDNSNSAAAAATVDNYNDHDTKNGD